MSVASDRPNRRPKGGRCRPKTVAGALADSIQKRTYALKIVSGRVGREKDAELRLQWRRSRHRNSLPEGDLILNQDLRFTDVKVVTSIAHLSNAILCSTPLSVSAEREWKTKTSNNKMARIRKIEVQNFRGVNELVWLPQPGVNCLIGPGDSGKSTVLDAIDWCLGARRSVPVTDADFHQMNIDNEIFIEITIGDLHDDLKSLDAYGPYLRGFKDDGETEDEPGDGLETVLSVRLIIGDDLEPRWTLVSERADAQGLSRNLSWPDRLKTAPSRIGAFANHHLSWQKGSILNLLSDEKADASTQLAKAAREARNSFGDFAGEQLEKTLSLVGEAAHALGVPVGEEVRAMLDAHSVSFSGGTISLHDSDGVPLRKLGLGSSRLLVAGLQNKAAEAASIALVDEVEIGLEPHRIAKFLRALGSKSPDQDFQIFMTTHSPIVLRELSANQLHIIRGGDAHVITHAGDADDVQGTLRSAPEAFLGGSVLICEGATEVGLIRGIDLYREENGLPTFGAAGGVCVDAGGVTKIYRNGKPFSRLGYHCAALRDDDRKPESADEETFEDQGGVVFKWTDGWAFEDELFACLSDDAVYDLWSLAAEIHGEAKVEAHLTTACNEAHDLDEWLEDIDQEKRSLLAKAAKQGEWFKRISYMEQAAQNVVAPDLQYAHEDLRSVIESIYKWAGVT